MENNSNKIILDINLDQVLNADSEEISSKPSRWSRIKNKVGCTNTSTLGPLAQKLINTDLIPESKLRLLKNEGPHCDPVSAMDARHEEAKKTRKYNDRRDTSWNVDIMSEAKRMVKQERLQDLYRRRQIGMIDRELNNFKKELNAHKLVLSRDNKNIPRLCQDSVPWEVNEFWENLPEPGENKCIKTDTPKLISTNGRHRPYRNSRIKNNNKVQDDKSQPEDEDNSHNLQVIILEEAADEIISEANHFNEETENHKTGKKDEVNSYDHLVANEENSQDGAKSTVPEDEHSKNFSSIFTDAKQSTLQDSVCKIIQEESYTNNEQPFSNYGGREIQEVNKEDDNNECKIVDENELEKLTIESVSLKPCKELCVSSANFEQEPEPIKEVIDYQQKNKSKLKRKAFAQWKSYCARKIEEDRKMKMEDEEKQKEPITNRIDSFLKTLQERKKMLNNFSNSTEVLKTPDFDVSTKKKKSSSAPLQTRYQHRFVAQQNVISQQKSKLLEQERLIQQLRAKRLSADARDSVQQACSVYLDTVRSSDKIHGAGDEKRRIRHTVGGVCLKVEVDRLVTKEIETEENEDDSLRLISHAAPAFLQAMDQRAQQRQIRHEAAQERRLQREEQLRLAKESAELAKLEEDRDAKLFRVAERRRKREEEQERQRCLEQERNRIHALEHIADQHVRQKLLRRYGLEPLKRLVDMKYCDALLAKEHHRQKLMKSSLQLWHQKTKDIVEEKLAKAVNFNNLRLLRIYYAGWFEYHMEIRSNLLVAEDWYNLRTLERMVVEWNRTAKKLIIERDKKCYIAQLHYERQLKWRSIDKWRLLPSFNEIARQREKRKSKWRNKIWEILPDYKPITED